MILDNKLKKYILIAGGFQCTPKKATDFFSGLFLHVGGGDVYYLQMVHVAAEKLISCPLAHPSRGTKINTENQFRR